MSSSATSPFSTADHFAILATGCDLMTLDNLTIDTNRDGIDIDCCRNTTVSNCRINSPNDDGLCPKSTLALGRRVITENLTIVNCRVSGFEEGTLLDGRMIRGKGGYGRIKFGTESNGGFRNITVANCTFRSCHGLALEEVDGGILENISISNLTMMDVIDYPIYITLGRRNRGPHETPTGTVRNISISNVIATGVDPMSGIQITGLPGHYVEGIRLENIRLGFKGGGTRKDAARVPPELDNGYPEPQNIGIMPSYGLFARHVRDLELADIRFTLENDDLRPAMTCIDVNGLEIDNFKADLTDGVPAARFSHVKGLGRPQFASPSAHGAKAETQSQTRPGPYEIVPSLGFPTAFSPSSRVGTILSSRSKQLVWMMRPSRGESPHSTSRPWFCMTRCRMFISIPSIALPT